MQKLFTIILFVCSIQFVSAQSDVEIAPKTKTDTQIQTEAKLRTEVKAKENEGWIVEKVETTIYAPAADNELQKSINQDETTVLSKEEFDKRFHDERQEKPQTPENKSH
jgi:hypothetical protein